MRISSRLAKGNPLRQNKIVSYVSNAKQNRKQKKKKNVKGLVNEIHPG